jgi:hypothetical protein
VVVVVVMMMMRLWLRLCNSTLAHFHSSCLAKK